MRLLREIMVSILLALAPGVLVVLGVILGVGTVLWLVHRPEGADAPPHCGLFVFALLVETFILAAPALLLGAVVGGGIGLIAANRLCEAYELSHPPSELEEIT